MAKIALLLIFFLQSFWHPIHVSVTEIEHDQDSKRLEIAMRVFVDDLELAIRDAESNRELNIMKPGGSLTTDQLVEKYLKSHFGIAVNGKNQDITYLGHELELPAMYIYMTIDGVKKLKDLKISNDMIMDVYDDQTHIFHVKYDDTEKSFRLTESEKVKLLTF